MSAFRVGFLLVDGFALMSYSSAVEPLRAANHLAGKKLYDIRQLPVMGGRAVSSSGAVVNASAHVGEQVDYDLLLVVAGGDPARFANSNTFQWLRQLARRDVWLGGVSGGPVILALAGIMDNRRMTLHWEHVDALKEISPDLLVERSLFVIDRDRMTCAGGTAPLDMMHALIQSQHGAAFATEVSDWFMHTTIRPSAGPQRSGLAQRYQTHDASVLVAIDAMENHIADPLSLEQLARLTDLGTRQMNRLFKDKLGISTIAFYRKLRADKARNLLQQSSMSITDVALATGFASASHLARCYRELYGESPSMVRSSTVFE